MATRHAGPVAPCETEFADLVADLRRRTGRTQPLRRMMCLRRRRRRLRGGHATPSVLIRIAPGRSPERAVFRPGCARIEPQGLWFPPRPVAELRCRPGRPLRARSTD